MSLAWLGGRLEGICSGCLIYLLPPEIVASEPGRSVRAPGDNYPCKWAVFRSIWEVGMLRLSSPQAECLWDEVLPIEVRELPEDLAKLEPYLRSADLVLGSRAVADSNVTRHQPIYRSLMGKAFNKIIRVLAVKEIRDTQCGFKLLDGEVIYRAPDFDL